MGRPLAADALVQQLVGRFAELPQVEAVTLGGSRASGRADDASDLDVYVHANGVIPLATRQRVVEQLGGASVADLGLDYFGDGDEWVDARTGVRFDVIYFGLEWLREQVERPLVQHQPSLGYSTAFAYTVSRARIMHDPEGKFAALQAVTREPYPEALRQNIVRYNHPMLRGTLSSYREQLEKAAARYDFVSLNHRQAALLASYFDLVFAVNRSLHPGEKRLVATALALPSLPESFERDVTEVLKVAGDAVRLLSALTRLLDALDAWLTREGFDVSRAQPVRIARAG